MTEETGTLAELNVKPGDVVECVRDAGFNNYTVGKEYTIQGSGETVQDSGSKMNGSLSIFRLVSRASDTEGDECHTPLADMGFSTVEATVSGVYKEPANPKTWGEMTDEEKGALLLAHHDGKVIEFYCYDMWMCIYNATWLDTCAYRVRPPEPKRETVTIYGAPSKHIQWCLEQCGLDTHRITLPLLDGNIPAGTYTSEAGETIIVEEL